MVASELRCGNLIYATVRPYEESKQIIKVEPTILMVLNGEVKRENLRFEPIPLTEEILLKCGFEEEDGWLFIENKQGSFGIRKENNTWLFYWFDDTPLNYVHQLQNLYFALTGQELNVKL